MNIVLFDIRGSRSELANLVEQLLFKTLHLVKNLVYKISCFNLKNQ